MARTRYAFVAAVSLFLASATAMAAVPSLLQPSWAELNPQQKQILNPLAGDWDNLDQARRSKWLGIAQRYPSMSADEQARIQRRMQAWAKLTPEERKQAREKFLSLQKAPPEKKEAIKQKWQEYKELPDSEKARLKQAAAQKPQPRPGAGKSVPLTRTKEAPAGSGRVTSPPVTPSPAQVTPSAPDQKPAVALPAATPGPAPATAPGADTLPAR